MILSFASKNRYLATRPSWTYLSVCSRRINLLWTKAMKRLKLSWLAVSFNKNLRTSRSINQMLVLIRDINHPKNLSQLWRESRRPDKVVDSNRLSKNMMRRKLNEIHKRLRNILTWLFRKNQIKKICTSIIHLYHLL